MRLLGCLWLVYLFKVVVDEFRSVGNCQSIIVSLNLVIIKLLENDDEKGKILGDRSLNLKKKKNWKKAYLVTH